MTESTTTVGDLYEAKLITDADLRSAVDAFMDDPEIASHVFPGGCRVDVAKAVRANEWTSAQFRSPVATEALKRVAVRTAILLARPEKA